MKREKESRFKLQKLRFDPIFTFIFFSIVAFGTSMIFSASSSFGMELTNDKYMFLKSHLLYLALGIVVMIVVMLVPLQFVRKNIRLINIFTIAFLVMLVVFPSMVVTVNGAGRWLNLFGFTFQPSEIAKLAFILTFAHIIDLLVRKKKINKLSLDGMGQAIIYAGLIVGLILMKTHLSASMLILLVGLSMLVVAGLKMRYVLTIGAVGIVTAIIAIFSNPFRIERFQAIFDPFLDANDTGYQVVQAWYGLGSGEWFGLGIGMSRQKFNWLPEKHTDFIVAVIGEEIGYVGVTAMIIAFAALIIHGITMASKIKDEDQYGALVVFGVTSLIFFQTFINLAVVSGLFPTTGMPLPFVSFGGTSTVIMFAAIGLMFNVISKAKK